MTDTPPENAFPEVTLEGKVVRLEPLKMAHHAGLCAVGLDEDLWRLTTIIVRTPGDMTQYIASALRQRNAGMALPFAIVERETGNVIGSSRFLNIDRANRRIEIGATWVARRWQRTAVNTETKFLLLTHAFETLGCLRVEFKTDSLNARSQKALIRIGAKQEGTLRSHMIVAGGRIRDSVYFSIIADEWPSVKVSLMKMLGR